MIPTTSPPPPSQALQQLSELASSSSRLSQLAAATTLLRRQEGAHNNVARKNLVPGAYQVNDGQFERAQMGTITKLEENRHRPPEYCGMSSSDEDENYRNNYNHMNGPPRSALSSDGSISTNNTSYGLDGQLLTEAEFKLNRQRRRRRYVWICVGLVVLIVASTILTAVLRRTTSSELDEQQQQQAGDGGNGNNNFGSGNSNSAGGVLGQEREDLENALKHWTEFFAVCEARKVLVDETMLSRTTRNRVIDIQSHLALLVQAVRLGEGEEESEIVNIRDCSYQDMAMMSMALIEPNNNNTAALSWSELLFEDNYEERYLLSVFFFSTLGYDWFNRTGWLSSESICTWHGVTCSGDSDDDDDDDTAVTRTVIALRLPSNGLQGQLPQEIYWLSSLRYLSLGDNKIQGTLSSTSMHQLSQLRTLDLNLNNMSGTLPTTIGSLKRLRSLRLNSPNWNGTIPGQIGLLWRTLERLVVEGGKLTGTIPTELRRLSALKTMVLDGGDYWGSFPEKIWLLPNLEEIRLLGGGGGSSVSIRFPDNAFENSTNNNWKRIEIGSYAISDMLPTTLGALTDLEELIVTKSGVVGTIPSEIGRCTGLRRMDLRGNGLTGSLPKELGNLSLLEELVLESNQIKGTIPAELSNLTLLEEMRLQLQGEGVCGEGFVGSFPEELCDLPSLNIIVLTCDCALYESCPQGCCDCERRGSNNDEPVG